MILEGVVTTRNEDGSVNVAPMGPIVDPPDPQLSRLVLRPYRSSTTYANARRTGSGIFHVVDDVQLLARAAIGQFDRPPETRPAPGGQGEILTAACRWYAFEVETLRDEDQRTWIECRVVDQGRLRDFWGFNRARHAVLEAAILATRIGILPADEIRDQLQRLAPLVEKTAGPREHAAWQLLIEYIDRHLP